MHDEDTREKWRAHNRRRREQAKRDGLCTSCLARKAVLGKSQCTVCRNKRAARAAAA